MACAGAALGAQLAGLGIGISPSRPGGGRFTILGTSSFGIGDAGVIGEAGVSDVIITLGGVGTGSAAAVGFSSAGVGVSVVGSDDGLLVPPSSGASCTPSTGFAAGCDAATSHSVVSGNVFSGGARCCSFDMSPARASGNVGVGIVAATSVDLASSPATSCDDLSPLGPNVSGSGFAGAADSVDCSDAAAGTSTPAGSGGFASD